MNKLFNIVFICISICCICLAAILSCSVEEDLWAGFSALVLLVAGCCILSCTIKEKED